MRNVHIAITAKYIWNKPPNSSVPTKFRRYIGAHTVVLKTSMQVASLQISVHWRRRIILKFYEQFILAIEN